MCRRLASGNVGWGGSVGVRPKCSSEPIADFWVRNATPENVAARLEHAQLVASEIFRFPSEFFFSFLFYLFFFFCCIVDFFHWQKGSKPNAFCASFKNVNLFIYQCSPPPPPFGYPPQPLIPMDSVPEEQKANVGHFGTPFSHKHFNEKYQRNCF